MTDHMIADGAVRLTIEFDAPKKPKRIYSLEEVKEQIAWHRSRVEILQDRIANGECTEETEGDSGEQNASISHEVGLRATITPPPYPPYGLEEIDLPRASSEEKA